MPNILTSLEEIADNLSEAATLIKNPSKDKITEDLLIEVCDLWNEIAEYSSLTNLPIDIEAIDLNDKDPVVRKIDARTIRKYRDEVEDELDQFKEFFSETESESSTSEEELKDEGSENSATSDSEEEEIKNENNAVLEESKEIKDTIVSPKTGKIRKRLSDKFEGYEDADEAKEKEWNRAKKSEERFYDYLRNRSPGTRQLVGTFLHNRRTLGETALIDTNGISARRLITADAYAVKYSLQTAPSQEIKNGADIVKNLGWHKKGGRNWNREKVLRGYKIVGGERRGTEVNYQFLPGAGNLGNIKVDGVGKYGDGASEGRTPNILYVVNNITGQDPAKERILAKLLIGFSRFGGGFTADMLREEKFNLYSDKTDRDKQVEQLNRLAYLVCIKEISRRKNQGKKSVRKLFKDVEEFPFGVAVTKTLQLLKDGHLRMNEVLDKDSPYGVFTGNEIMHEKNLGKTRKKFQDVFKLYARVYGGEEVQAFLRQYPGGSVVAFRETHHKDLLVVNGGAEDSCGEEYLSSDEDTLKLTAQVQKLQV